MRAFTIAGVVCEKTSGAPLMAAAVRAYDRDQFVDELVGEAVTSADGRFEISSDVPAFVDFVEDSPDVSVEVRLPGGRVHRSRHDLRWSAGRLEPLTINVAREPPDAGDTRRWQSVALQEAPQTYSHPQ